MSEFEYDEANYYGDLGEALAAGQRPPWWTPPTLDDPDWDRDHREALEGGGPDAA